MKYKEIIIDIMRLIYNNDNSNNAISRNNNNTRFRFNKKHKS